MLQEKNSTSVEKKKKKVLLIEDDRTMRRIVRSKIGGECDLYEAGSGSTGLSTFRDLKPDLVFLDIGLPDGDGMNLLNWMLKTNPKTFVVMFSGHSNTNCVFKAIETGAKGFISKPFSMEKMMFFIENCDVEES